ncbi:Gfo/Idh/MocA family protein [Brachybacterium sp. ACRRE]|uniref:Gfo/Idh/MocA family protein n=1 Tax=Brachybacterium sp. ACRRE TaxID=2918184 RepID=UPI001EF2CC1A|nr:Gfo/Idh/MocA family oxidoreductase [Brachybacterium sp. ACRRE]MCG7310998.1 Gfo/Idh/MocA family oxidoreductase [Brachybacterium sp. ACRRE]
MSTLRIGIIGAGTIARAHLDAYAVHPEAELVAISDVHLERARTVAEEYGARRAYGDPHELLADPEVDAVSICTWNNTHAEWAIAAVRAGKHVLVEKPLARTLEEAERIQEAAAGSDRVLQVGFVRRHAPNCQVLKSFIDAGDLGEIYYAKASCIRRAGNPGGWFADKGIAGGGPLLDIGIHVLDLCWYLMGSPTAVTVSGSTFDLLGNRADITTLPRYQASDHDPAANSVEDMATALVRFDNGSTLQIDCSYSLHATQDSISVSVFGDKGGADLEPRLSIATEMHDSIVNVTPQIGSGTFEMEAGFRAEISHFLDSCLGRTENLAPVGHGVEIVRILEAIYASAAQGREVALS